MKKIIVTVCDNMSDETYKLLVDGIKTRFGEDSVITKQVDNSLIGGFVLNVDGVVFDSSVSSQLLEIKKEMNS